MYKSEILDTILDSIIPISIISIILLICVLILRTIFHLILHIASFFYVKKKKIKKQQPKTEITSYKKEEEELLRDKKLEDKKTKEQIKLEGVKRMGDDFEKQSSVFEDGRIVGIAKPIGFWTSLILGDQLSQILGRASALNDRSHKGFWVSMLEAQARGFGRKKSRMR